MNIDPVDLEERLDSFLQLCAGIIVRHGDSERFLEWISAYGAAHLPELVADIDHAVQRPRQVFLALGREIWQATPLPHKHFAREQLPLPGRNDPCYCGSERKFKHCCGQWQSIGKAMMPMDLLPYVLAVLPKKRWSELPGSAVSIDSVGAAAFQMLQDGYPDDTAKLLAPWFTSEGRWPNRLAGLFDLLLDAYEALGKRKKRKDMALAATERSEPQVAAIGWQRLATMRADEGDLTGAWEAFTQAQRADPENPSLGMLEVTLLLSKKEWEQARRRAQFWAARLARVYGNQEPGVLAYLRQVADDPQQALNNMNVQRVPRLGELMSLLAQAPAVSCNFRLDPDEGLAGPLEPVSALKKARRVWENAFPSARPFSVEMSTYNDAAWADIDQWLSVLRAHPVLWQDFQVLDDLVCAMDGLNTLGIDDMVRQLTDRALILLDCVLTDQHATEMQLEWGFLENRPALRLVVRHILERRASGDEDTALPWLERMVNVLNPNDNHGLRDILMAAYLKRGDICNAVKLADRYPDDMGAMRYNRALAHFLAGDTEQADAILRDALKKYPLIGKTLLSKRAAKPKEGFITLGSQDEANHYRSQYLSLWSTEAIAWLGSVMKTRIGKTT